MRRGFSPVKSKLIEQARQDSQQRKIPINRAADYNKYFCHYNNAVYMGGMSSYKKHGKGILLHDDGSAAITEYLHDTPTGHTVIFRENSISSVFYRSNVQFQVAYKQGKYVIVIPFNDSTLKAHGVGVLIDYVDFKIYRLVFKKGELVQKIMHMDRRDSEDVFHKNIATKVIGVKHEQAFNGDFQTPNRVQIKNQANKSTVGYFDQNGEIHGLSFSFYGQNLRTHGQRSLYLSFIEKGYYRDSQLQTFGQKLFRNGNKYIGQFDKGQFHGRGILICPSEFKWVYGNFERGQMTELIESNHKRFTEQQFEVWAQSLRAIHKRYRQRWIDLDIELPQETYLYNILKIAIESPTTYIDPDKIGLQKDEQWRMTRIQHQFQQEKPGSMHNSYVEKQLERHYVFKQKSPSKKPIRKEQIQRPYTPIDKFKSSTSQKNSLLKTQVSFRQQDPFKLNLTKISADSKTRSQTEPILIKQKVQTRPPLGEPVLRNSRQKHLPSHYDPYYYGYNRHKYRDHSQIDSIYNSTYYDALRNNKQSRVEDDELYYSRLRSGLESSPVHRNYYSTPPKYKQGYLERYNGKISHNKNVDQYYDQNGRKQSNIAPNTSKYYPNEEPTIYSTSKSGTPSNNRSGKKKSTSPKDQQQSYNSRKRSQSPNENQQNSRKYIKNSNQYWKDRN